MTAKIFHPLLSMIASASDSEMARYIEFLKEENKILRARVPGQIHTKPDERSRLVKLGKALGRAVEELITLVAPSTFYRVCARVTIIAPPPLRPEPASHHQRRGSRPPQASQSRHESLPPVGQTSITEPAAYLAVDPEQSSAVAASRGGAFNLPTQFTQSRNLRVQTAIAQIVHPDSQSLRHPQRRLASRQANF